MSAHSRSHAEAVQQLRDLPPPAPEALAQSERLIELLRARMAEAGGSIDFERFMELALYAPGVGYYSGGSLKFGAEGDFVTAPEISPLFSHSLARQVADVLDALNGGEVLEFGAGRGVMAAEVLVELERLGCLPARYLILDLSAELRERQRATIAARVPHLLGRVTWVDTLPAPGWRGVVLANEVLDAMPVTRFMVDADGDPRALRVTWHEGRLAFIAGDFEDPAVAGRVGELIDRYELPPGYCSEINLAAEGWVRSLGDFLAAGAAFIIDYGFPAHEYYHPQRSMGTLMCHYRHRAHADVLLWPGLQDITAHVDFTAVAEVALAAGLAVSGFANQGNFLLACGIIEMAQAIEGDAAAQWDVANQLKRLTMPGEMGELFKVLALTRGVEGPLRGFALRDERGRLSW